MFLASAALATIAAPAAAQTIAITNGRVVVGDGSEPIENGTVVLRGGSACATHISTVSDLPIIFRVSFQRVPSPYGPSDLSSRASRAVRRARSPASPPGKFGPRASRSRAPWVIA